MLQGVNDSNWLLQLFSDHLSWFEVVDSKIGLRRCICCTRIRKSRFLPVSDYIETLIIKRRYDRITPLYGMLVWFKKVDCTVRQQIEAEKWYATWKGNSFFVLEYAMSSDNIFISDFRDLLRSITGPSSTGIKFQWSLQKNSSQQWPSLCFETSPSQCSRTSSTS